MERRAFLARALAGGAAGSVAVAGTLHAMQGAGASEQQTAAPMNQDAARQVRLPPKPGATPQLDADGIHVLEKGIRCQCGCTLDVYTCRTTDFSCSVSPAMHRDVLALVEGGYSAQEIVDAFIATYGERALMAPTKRGFNLVGWIAPFAALLVALAVLVVLLRTWRARGVAREAVAAPAAPSDATADELRRLEAAVRDDR